MMSAHQTKDKILTANKNNNREILDNPNLCKYYVEIDGQRYPRVGRAINYTENDYIDQYEELKLFFLRI